MSESNKFNHVTFGLILGIAIFASIVALWALISGEGPQSVSNNYETSKYHDSATCRVDATCTGLQGVAVTECKIQIEQSERENHRAQKDLRAQRYMAIWALFMAVSAVGTLVVTVIGLNWIRETLVETRQAVKAADDAVRVTMEIGNRQLAPHLFCESVSGAFLGKEAWLRFTLRNSGMTPARSANSNFRVEFFDINGRIINNTDVDMSLDHIAGIFPNQSILLESSRFKWPDNSSARVTIMVSCSDPNAKTEIGNSFVFISIGRVSKFALRG